MFRVVLVFPAYRQPAFLDRSGGPRPPLARIPFSGGKYYLDKPAPFPSQHSTKNVDTAGSEGARDLESNVFQHK